MTNTMQAVQIHRYGDTDALSVEDIPVPELQSGFVLVKVHAAAVNPVDWKIRKGYLDGMLGHELPLTLGWDLAGEVAAVADDVNDWKVGDAVYSRPNISLNGSQAEYILVKADELAAKPASLNWQEAAAVPLAALTAWQALIDAANIQPGHKVLIHAGAGGVGSFAIQLAKAKGAYVMTTASTRNIEFLQSLGADEVIDYTQQNFSELRDIDIVFDTMGGEIQAQSWQVLKTGGFLVSIVDTPDEDTAKQHQVQSAFVFVQPDREQLTELATLIDAGKLKVNIDSVYELADIAAAHQRSESGRARGKIIIQVS